MDKDTRKIALACFAGGVAFGVAHLISTLFMGPLSIASLAMSVAAGLATGYVAHEFRENLRAIPKALQAVGGGGAEVWMEAIGFARKWLAQPHPFGYLGALFAPPVPFLVLSLLWPSVKGPGTATLTFFLVVACYLEAAMILSGPFGTLAFIGARIGERCYWIPTQQNMDAFGDQSIWFAEMEKKGYRQVPMTYPDAARWMGKGLGIVILFFTWHVWYGLAMGAGIAIDFLARFAWHLFRLVHTKEKVLCTLDGTAGGLVAHILLSSSATTVEQHVLMILFGGVMGAAWGVLNHKLWKVVVKRYPHLALQQS